MSAKVTGTILLCVCCSTFAAAAAAAPAGAAQKSQQRQASAADVTRPLLPAVAATSECVLSLSGRTEFFDGFYGTAKMACTGGGKVVVALAPELKSFKPSFTGVEFSEYDYPQWGIVDRNCLVVLLGDTRAAIVRSTITNVFHNLPVLCVGGNSNVTLKGITVANNKGFGLVAMDNARVHVTDGSRFINTTGGQHPSAIIAAGQAQVIITGKSVVRANRSPFCGGGVSAHDSAKVVIAGSRISDNAGPGGGGVCANDNATVSICCGSVISNNTSFKPGGCHGGIYGVGLLVRDNATMHIKDTELTDNQSAIGGGVYAEGRYARVHVDNSILTRNRAIVGGALSTAAGASLLLRNSKLDRNAALAGGAIYAGEHARITAESCGVTSNAAAAGGALLAAKATATFASSTINGNVAAAGGGVWAENSNITFIGRSSINTNVANVGGALFGAAGAGFELAAGSVLAGNVAQFGSAIWLQDSTGASVTFFAGGELAGSNSAATGTMPTAPLPKGMTIDDGLLELPGALDPIIPATTPGTLGSKLSLPEAANYCFFRASRVYDSGSYLHAVAVALTVDTEASRSQKPTNVRPLQRSTKCPGSGSASSDLSRPLPQGTLC